MSIKNVTDWLKTFFCCCCIKLKSWNISRKKVEAQYHPFYIGWQLLRSLPPITEPISSLQSIRPWLTHMVLHDIKIWSIQLLGFIWLCCFLGIWVEACRPSWRYRGYFSLSMYLGMGWACLVCLPEISTRLPDTAINYLVLGGVGYTVGVPFFVRNNNLDHAVWHLFCLLYTSDAADD